MCAYCNHVPGGWGLSDGRTCIHLASRFCPPLLTSPAGRAQGGPFLSRSQSWCLLSTWGTEAIRRHLGEDRWCVCKCVRVYLGRASQEPASGADVAGQPRTGAGGIGETSGRGTTACWRGGQGEPEVGRGGAGWAGRGRVAGRPCQASNAHPNHFHADLVASLCDPCWSPGLSRQAGQGRWLGGRPPESVLLEPRRASAGLDCVPVCSLMQTSCNGLFKTQTHFS